MIAKLHGRQRMRKCALLLERAELDIVEGGDREKAQALALDLAGFLASDSESDQELKSLAEICAASLSTLESPDSVVRSINDFRHYLVRVSGQSPADWDLHDYRSMEGLAAKVQGFGEKNARSFFPGLRVFLEDIRSPFNVGSILRTAEALGFEEVLLSPACADPRHPRAARSSMGAVDLIPWRRCELEELSDSGLPIALELGGKSIQDFSFPPRGLLLLGSEELGLSQPALALAGSSRISIPMRGIKASLNVAVAFGIAAQAWVGSKSQA
jgi:TrmH family RNA methyltransferase